MFSGIAACLITLSFFRSYRSEKNAATFPERQAILKEIMRTVPGSERVYATEWEQINFLK